MSNISKTFWVLLSAVFVSAGSAQAQTPTCASSIADALEAYELALDTLETVQQLCTAVTPPPPPPSAWPNATTTGPLAGTQLVSCASGVITSSKNGCLFSGPIQIAANNVTISNSVVDAQGNLNVSYAIGNGGTPRTGTRLQNVRVLGAPNGKCVYLPGAAWIGDKLDISNCNDGLFGPDMTLTDSFVHDVTVGGGRHSDGYQTAGGRNVVLRGNNIIVQTGAANSAIFISANPGVVDNYLIEGNRLGGGTFVVYCGAQGGPVPTNMRFLNNTFVRGSSSFGPHSLGPCPSAAGWQWSGNKFEDGEVVP